MPETSVHFRLVAAILLAALVVRLAWGLSRPADDAAALQSLPDQLEYLTLGRNLLAGKGLVFHDDRIDADAYAFRSPGYPFLVAVCGGNIRVIRVVQAVLDTSTALAAYLLARRWLDVRRSIIALAIVALNPFLIYFSALILSETLFIGLMVWGMAVLVRPRAMIAGSLLLALSVLVRPGAIVLPTLLGVVGAVTCRKPWWHGFVAAAALTVLVLAPWAWRNNRVVGKSVWTTTNAGITLYDGFNPSATGASDQRFVTDMAGQLHQMSETERSELLGRLARQFISDHPGRAVALTGAKLARLWSPVPLSREYGANPKIVLIALVYTVPLFALAAAGLWVRGRLPRSAKVFFIVPAIYFTMAHALSVGSLRYRLPADVPMAVLAASVFKRLEGKG